MTVVANTNTFMAAWSSSHAPVFRKHRAALAVINGVIAEKYEDGTFSEGDDITGYSNSGNPIEFSLLRHRLQVWFKVSFYCEEHHQWICDITNVCPDRRTYTVPRQLSNLAKDSRSLDSDYRPDPEDLCAINAVERFIADRYEEGTFAEGDDLVGYSNFNEPVVYICDFESEYDEIGDDQYSNRKQVWFIITHYDLDRHIWRYNVYHARHTFRRGLKQLALTATRPSLEDGNCY